MIHLYLKESPLGLKYLGKTIKNPYEYMGSGLVWQRHIKKHNLTAEDIKTTVIYSDNNKKRFSYYATKISKALNVVLSIEYANLVEEQGQGGCTYYCISEEGKKRFHDSTRKPKTESQKKKISKALIGHPSHSRKKVVQYDMDWNLIAIHDCMADACRSLGKKGNNDSEIRYAIKGYRTKKYKGEIRTYKCNHAFGFKWKDYEQYKKDIS